MNNNVIKQKITFVALSIITCFALVFSAISSYSNVSALHAEIMNDTYQNYADSSSYVQVTNGDVSFGERALTKVENAFELQENGAVGMVLHGYSGSNFSFKRPIDISTLTWTNQNNYDPIIEYIITPNTGKQVRYNANVNGILSEDISYLAGRELDSLNIYVYDSENKNKGIYINVVPSEIRENANTACSAKYFFKDIETGNTISIVGRTGEVNDSDGIKNSSGLEYFNTGFSGTASYASGFTIVPEGDKKAFYIGKYHHAGTNHKLIEDVSKYFPSGKVTVDVKFGTVLSGADRTFPISGAYGANCVIDDNSKWNNTDTYVVVSALGGEKFNNFISVKDSYDGVVNKNYIVPSPTAIVGNNVVTDATFKYVIKNEAGEIIKNEATYSNTDNSFTPTALGKYKVVFTTTASNKTVTGTYNFEIKSSQAVTITPSVEPSEGGFNTLNKVEDESYVYNIGAKASSTIYKSKTTPNVDVKIEWYNGSTYEVETTKTNVKEVENYHFAKLGKYKLTYTASDVIGNTATTIREFNVNRYYSKFNVSDVEIFDISSNENSFSIDKSLLTIYDVYLGNDCHLTNGTFKVKYKKSTENTYSEDGLTLGNNIFNELGEYDVKVEYDFAGGVIQKEFVVNVVDNGVPELIFVGDQSAMGQVQFIEKDGKTETYNAVLDSNIVFSKLLAVDVVAGNSVNISDRITASLKVVVDNQIIHSDSISLQGETFSVNLNSFGKGEGKYIFSFYVEDQTGNTNYRIIIFDAKNKLGKIKLPNVIKDLYDTVNGIDLTGVKAVDMYGVEDNSVTITTKIYKGGEELQSFVGSNIVYLPEKSGEYEIVIKASQNGKEVFDEIRKTVTVEDKTAPVIRVKGKVQKTGRVGFEFVLPEFSSTDANAPFTMPTVKVTYNDFEVNVYGGKFTPTEEGKYMVTVLADDGYGNVATYSYEIEVGKGVSKKITFDGLTITLAVVGGASLIAIVILIMLIAKKKKKS